MSTLIDRGATLKRATGALLASDGFGGAFGTTDGAGANVGGGSGKSWTQVGTWTTSGGRANASALTGGLAMATVNTGRGDVMVSVRLIRASGNAGVLARYVDANNLVGVRHTGTNAQLFKIIASVATTLVDVASTYVADAPIGLWCAGNKFRLYYNGLLVGTEQTIADAAVASAGLQGLRTTGTDNTFDAFTVFAL